MGAAASTGQALETTITVGSSPWFSVGTDDSFSAFGYNDALADPSGINTMGSISDPNWTDGGASPRVVSAVYYLENTGGISSIDDSLNFGVVGVSVPDTDITFTEIEYAGVIYTRASADTYIANVAGVVSWWRWLNVSPNPPSFGVQPFEVRI